MAFFAQPWVLAAYVVAAMALAAPGERRPGLGSLVVAGKVAALMGLFWGPALLPGGNTIFEGEPTSWIPFAAIVIVGLAALLVRARPQTSRRAPRDVVLAATPFVLAAGAFALAVVLLPDVRWERWLFLPTLVAGAVLLAWPRRTLVRAAIPPAIALAAVSVLAMGAGVRLEGGVGDTSESPRDAAELPRELRRAVGDVRLDLSHLRPGTGRVAVDASVGVGTIDVTVPRRTLVELDGRVGQGRHHLDDIARRRASNAKLHERNGRVLGRGIPVSDSGRPVKPRMRLRLRLQAGVGEVTVGEESFRTRWMLR